MQLIDINLIDTWDLNGKWSTISAAGERRLEESLKLGQHTPLLVSETSDGRYKAIGGNHRLKKMKEMGYKEIGIVVLSWQEIDGKFAPLFDGVSSWGENRPKFDTVEEGEIAVALSHNTNPAHYVQEAFVEIMGEFPSIDIEMFDGQFTDPVNLSDQFEHGMNRSELPEDSVEGATRIECPHCNKSIYLNKPAKVIMVAGEEGDSSSNPQTQQDQPLTPEQMEQQLRQAQQQAEQQSQ